MPYWKYTVTVVIYIKAEDETEAVSQGRQRIEEAAADWEYDIELIAEEVYNLQEVYNLREGYNLREFDNLRAE